MKSGRLIGFGSHVSGRKCDLDGLIDLLKGVEPKGARDQVARIIGGRWIGTPVYRRICPGHYKALPSLVNVAHTAMWFAEEKRIAPRGYSVMLNDINKIRDLTTSLSKSLRKFPEDTLNWIDRPASTFRIAKGEDALILADALPLHVWDEWVAELVKNGHAQYPTLSHPSLPNRLDSLARTFQSLIDMAKDEMRDRNGVQIVNDHLRPVDLRIFNGLAAVLRAREENLSNLRPIAVAIYTWATGGEIPACNWAAREEKEARKVFARTNKPQGENLGGV
jgi:hypothetical protein